MLRLIDGMFYKGKLSDEWDMRVYCLGNTQKEAVLSRVIVWEELCKARPEEVAKWEADKAEDAAERHQENLKRAARRAKTRVRRMVKVLGLDALLTLTYRANMQDLALCKVHLKEFIRRIKRAIPGFVYVAAFERQARGAWHVHLAIHKLPVALNASNGVKVKSYMIVRKIWQSVVGDLGGNIDQSRRQRYSRHSVGKLAAYLSKYMLKAFEDGDSWSNRYSGSQGVDIPPAVHIRWRGEHLADLVALAYAEIAGPGTECVGWLSGHKDLFFLSSEPAFSVVTSPP